MAQRKDLKKAYANLAKKYRLPDFDHLDSEFEISRIDSEKFVLREIRRRVHDKIDIITKNLDSILHPDATLPNMYESGVFSDDEKKGIYQIYKFMMSMDRASTVIEIVGEEKKDAEFIREFAAKWVQLKPQVAEIFSRLEDSWKKDSYIEEKLGYFG